MFGWSCGGKRKGRTSEAPACLLHFVLFCFNSCTGTNAHPVVNAVSVDTVARKQCTTIRLSFSDCEKATPPSSSPAFLFFFFLSCLLLCVCVFFVCQHSSPVALLFLLLLCVTFPPAFFLFPFFSLLVFLFLFCVVFFLLVAP